MKKIAIVGKARSGKTTVLEMMMKAYKEQGMNVITYDVSHALYKITETLFPGSVSGEHKDRQKLQLVAKTIRDFVPTFWIDTMHDAILNDERHEYVDVIILTGFRQKNEFEYLKEHEYEIVKVIAPEQLRKQRARNAGDVNIEETFEHPTEKYLDKVIADYEILNVGSNKRELEYAIREIM